MKTRKTEIPPGFAGFLDLRALLVHGNSRERLEREVVSALLANEIPPAPEPLHPGKEERGGGGLGGGGECVLRRRRLHSRP